MTPFDFTPTAPSWHLEWSSIDEQLEWVRAMRGVAQSPVHHGEGDVWVHTGHVMDAFAARRVGDEWEDLVVGFAALCHDLG